MLKVQTKDGRTLEWDGQGNFDHFKGVGPKDVSAIYADGDEVGPILAGMQMRSKMIEVSEKLFAHLSGEMAEMVAPSGPAN